MSNEGYHSAITYILCYWHTLHLSIIYPHVKKYVHRQGWKTVQRNKNIVSNSISFHTYFNSIIWGASGWLSRLGVQLLILAQVLISQFMGSSPAWSPTSGSVLTVWSLLGIFSLPLSASPLLPLSKQMNRL